MSYLNYRSVIQSTGHYLPEKVVTNNDLAELMDTSDEWIEERTGIKQRRLVQDGVSTSFLATKAAEQALHNAGWDSKDVDLIIAATLSPDYYFPGIGVQVQNKLGARTIPALDIRGQCSGFVWGLATADGLLRTGAYRRALVVGAEIHSRLIEFSNRGRDVAVLFGDGAGAVALEAFSGDQRPLVSNNMRGIIDSLMGSDGSGLSHLYIQRPGHDGSSSFLSQAEAGEKAWLPKMEGRFVFKNAISRMVEACEAILARNNIKASDLDLLLPHQANLRINQMVAEKLGLKEHQVFNNIQNYGNTTAATIPLLMHDAKRLGLLKEGHLVLTVAFGSGFTWGANLIRF